jgi:hypothetical protein
MIPRGHKTGIRRDDAGKLDHAALKTRGAGKLVRAPKRPRE